MQILWHNCDLGKRDSFYIYTREMNWTNILKAAGTPEPPGREQALKKALERTQQRAQRRSLKKVKPRKA